LNRHGNQKYLRVSGFSESPGLNALVFHPGDSGNPNTTSFAGAGNKKLRHPSSSLAEKPQEVQDAGVSLDL
jgi:hypothetical protein